MGRLDRFRGILNDIKRKFYGDISRGKGEIQRDIIQDFSGRDPQARSFSQRAQVYLPPPLERAQVTIPESIRPFSDQVTFDRFEKKYRDVNTGLFVGRVDYLDRLSTQKREVMLASVSRKRPDLDAEEIGGLIDALMDRRQAISDISRDSAERRKLLDEDEEYNDLKEILDIQSPK